MTIKEMLHFVICPHNPEEIKTVIKETIGSAKTKTVEQVGLKLIKFCAKWDPRR